MNLDDLYKLREDCKAYGVSIEEYIEKIYIRRCEDCGHSFDMQAEGVVLSTGVKLIDDVPVGYYVIGCPKCNSTNLVKP